MSNDTNQLPRPFILEHEYQLWQKISYGLGQVLCILLTDILNFGIIWYENNVSDNRRTLINKMVAITSLYIMLFVTFGSGLAELLIFTFGPQPLIFCQLFLVSGFFFYTLFALGVTETMFVRYLYSHYFSTVAIVNEPFIRQYFLLLNLVLAFLINIVLYFSYSIERSHVFCFCAHISFDNFCPSGSSAKPIFIMTSISLILCLMCSLAIAVRKRKHPHLPQSNNQVLTHSLGTVKTTLFGTAVTVAFFCPCFLAFVVFNDYVRESWSDIDRKQHNIMAIFGLSFNALVGVFIPAIFYIRSQHLRDTIWKSVKENFPLCQNAVVSLN